MQADKNLLQQKWTVLADRPQKKNLPQKIKEVKAPEDVLSVATSSPEPVIVELTDSDTPPPSQNRPRTTGKAPAVADVRMHERVVQGLSTVDKRVVSSLVCLVCPLARVR